jgi:hypothetical protein
MASNESVICVYSAVASKPIVLDVLKNTLGFSVYMPWKLDATTLQGNYSKQFLSSKSDPLAFLVGIKNENADPESI